MYPGVKEVIPRDDHTLYIVFDNGKHGILDVKPFLDFGVFRRVKDLASFKRVRISFDTIEWDCGVDLDPEYIYAQYKELPTDA